MCDRCGPAVRALVPRGPAWRALPVRTLRQAAMAGALRARLDYLAGWRAGTDRQPQARPGRGGPHNIRLDPPRRRQHPPAELPGQQTSPAEEPAVVAK